MASIGQRGKWGEGQVKAWMKKQAEAQASFSFYRFPDARAGSFATVPSDFMAVRRSQPFFLEVKEVEHAFRLPHKNFAVDKVARMALWQVAGAMCWVLVCHMPDKVWRLVPLSEFQTRAGGSWDLSSYPLIALPVAMSLIFA
jgi:penicillin-binding protein-related factor A (putative recombinase)